MGLEATDGIAAVVQLATSHLESQQHRALAESALRLVLAQARNLANDLVDLETYLHARAEDTAQREQVQP